MVLKIFQTRVEIGEKHFIINSLAHEVQTVCDARLSTSSDSRDVAKIARVWLELSSQPRLFGDPR